MLASCSLLVDTTQCETNADCQSMICAKGTCCSEPCDGAEQQCLADGICHNIAAPAPALSDRVLAFAIALLAGVAGFALRRAYRSR